MGEISRSKKKSDKESTERSLSYKGRITLLFGLVSVMTALIAILVIAIAWESPMNEYAMRNLQTAADSTAEDLAETYEENGGWTDDVRIGAVFNGSNLVGVRLYDEFGNVIAQNEDGERFMEESGGDLDSASISATAEVVVDGKTVGTVVVWIMGGTGQILSSSDIQLRNGMYAAMLLASVIAVLISCLIGYLVAKGVVGPIRKITKTASEIKSGNLSARTNLVGTDEVSQLGMTFDDMAQSIENDRELERRLTNDVAHELRTPLMAMQATIEAMADGVMPADSQHLSMLDNEVIRLGRLVDAMLKLSRLENRSTPMNAEVIDLGETLEELAFSHQMLMEESNLEFEYSYEPGIMVKADPDLIKQATANVLSNAVRYTPEGGKVTVEVRRQNVMAQIIVKDTGIGMSQEDLKHIFSRFWRADAGRERASGGLGVGLAIVKEIVDRHNGWVHVDSVEGEGSTFTINIPLIKEDARKQNKKKQDKQEKTLQERLPIRYFKISGSSDGSDNYEFDEIGIEDYPFESVAGDDGNGSDATGSRSNRFWRGRDKGSGEPVASGGDGAVEYEIGEDETTDTTIGAQDDQSDSDNAD